VTERSDQETRTIPREIERKFLLSALPEFVATRTYAELAQGYIPGIEIHERLRKEVEGDAVRLVRTIKLGRGIERIEVEEPVPPELFARLWALTEGGRVEKRRYRVPDGDALWEIDAFTDRELVLAEIELASVDETVQFPAWLESYVVREVTDDPAYLNLKLAR